MTSVYAFSFKDEESEIVNKAREIAKRNNQSFSKLIMEALVKYVDEQKNPIARDNSAIGTAMTGTQNNIYILKNKNLSLDQFVKIPSSEFQQMLEEVDDYNTNSRLNRLLNTGIQQVKINFKRLK